MKKLLTIAAIFITTASFAQKEKIEVKNDTLIVPLGSCKVIKLGDKYYEVEVNLKEVPKPDTASGSIFYPQPLWNGVYTIPNASANLKSN